MGSLRRFLRLPYFQKLLFVQAAVWLLATGLALSWLGYRRWFTSLQRRAARRPVQGSSPLEDPREFARAASRLVSAAARRLPLPRNCLRESLVLWWLLQQRSITCELRLGGRRAQERFEAHAWVELQGEVLNDSPDVAMRFAPFQPADLPAEAEFQ